MPKNQIRAREAAHPTALIGIHPQADKTSRTLSETDSVHLDVKFVWWDYSPNRLQLWRGKMAKYRGKATIKINYSECRGASERARQPIPTTENQFCLLSVLKIANPRLRASSSASYLYRKYTVRLCPSTTNQNPPHTSPFSHSITNHES